MSSRVAEHLLSAPELRKFGWMMGAVIALIFGLVLPWIWSFDYPLWPWILATVFALIALMAPLALAPVLKVWMAIVEPVGRFNAAVILILMYALIIIQSIMIHCSRLNILNFKLLHKVHCRF